MTDPSPLTYKSAGHDLERSDAVIAAMKKKLPHIGGFGGDFPFPAGDYDDPVLVSGTDGVGTKLLVAVRAGKHDTIGIDCVAMVVNDVLVVGARPLFFLDYIGTGELEPGTIDQILTGLIEGCRQAGCLLVGGETAEMHGMYGPGHYDLVGFTVGAVDRARAVDGKAIRPGDAVVGLESSGIHSNGYTLARAVFQRVGAAPGERIEALGASADEALLTPTRIYVPCVLDLLERFTIKGMAHITGGGLEGNLNRTLPETCDARLDTALWPRPAIFDFMQERGPVDEAEMYRTFNMGIGYAVVVDAAEAEAVARRCGELGFPAHVIGEIAEGTGKVRLS